jgi:hypothetical protein
VAEHHDKQRVLTRAITCAKLGIVFWNYFGSRLAVPNQRDIPYLPQLVRHVTTD